MSSPAQPRAAALRAGGGPCSSNRRRALDVVIQSLVGRYAVLAYDEHAADWHARERARLDPLGRPTSFADGQIAATAATHDAVLVTRNVQDFSGYAGLKVVSWWAPGDDPAA